MKVKYSQITPSFRCGQIIEGTDGEQYVIRDAAEGEATLQKLDKEERVKPELLKGRVEL